jgi:hypothetical protein
MAFKSYNEYVLIKNKESLKKYLRSYPWGPNSLDYYGSFPIILESDVDYDSVTVLHTIVTKEEIENKVNSYKELLEALNERL